MRDFRDRQIDEAIEFAAVANAGTGCSVYVGDRAAQAGEESQQADGQEGFPRRDGCMGRPRRARGRERGAGAVCHGDADPRRLYRPPSASSAPAVLAVVCKARRRRSRARAGPGGHLRRRLVAIPMVVDAARVDAIGRLDRLAAQGRPRAQDNGILTSNATAQCPPDKWPRHLRASLMLL